MSSNRALRLLQGYAFKLPQGLPDNLPYDDAFATEFKGWAHEAGLIPRQAAVIHDKFALRAAKAFQDAEAAKTQRVAQAHRDIQAKWGEEGSVAYNRELEFASRALRKLGLVEGFKAAGMMMPNGMVADASVALAMANVGKTMFAEDSLHGEPGNLTAKNPWKEGQEDLSEQGRIFKANPEQAKALVIAAGKNPETELYHRR